MKNLVKLFLPLILILVFTNPLYATLFTDTYTFTDNEKYLSEGPIAGLFTKDSVSYEHDMPYDFEVPYDSVEYATLSIFAYWVSGNTSVAVEGTVLGSLSNGGSYGSLFWGLISWDIPSESTIDIASAFTSWNTDDNLDVTISTNGNLLDGWLELSSSTLTLSYENETAPAPAPVPEPATMLLLGTSLVGLAGATRKKIFKKN